MNNNQSYIAEAIGTFALVFIGGGAILSDALTGMGLLGVALAHGLVLMCMIYVLGHISGGHFNPDGTEHGFSPRDGYGKSHAGDMGNIEINEEGNGSLIIFLPGLSLVEGLKNVTGKAVILHAKEDNFGQPTGNAGGRIGCGIIELNK